MQRVFSQILAVSIAWAMFTVPCLGQAEENKRAIVVLDSPEVMRPWHRRYRWDATFRETGGKSGFEVWSTDFYILGPEGRRFNNSWSEKQRVRAGGAATVNYYIDINDKWAGGKFHCIWVGQDDVGNSIRIVQEVRIPK